MYICVCCVTMRDNFVTPYTQICGVKSDACLPANCSSFLLPTQDVVAFSCALSKDNQSNASVFHEKIYETWRLITVFTTAHHLIVSYTKRI